MEQKKISTRSYRLILWAFVGVLTNISYSQGQIDSSAKEIRIDSLAIDLNSPPLVLINNPTTKADTSLKVKKKTSIKNLPYLMDDLMLIGGLNQTTLAYSKEHRNISYQGGFQIGIENYTPLTEKSFMHFGLMYAQRGFRLNENKFYSHRLEIPLIFAYELPEFRQFDFRFLIGTQVSAQISSSESGEFLDHLDYRYRSAEFNAFDFGFTAGLSAEYGDFYLRCRTYFGANSLVKNDSATLAFFQFELGYFLFRRYRNVPIFEL